ncbi:hypothetical protein Zmor_000081 [Zophobas morio]|uniref:Uncharacterized protein n=1 Tax=Zophobas morio TaxID=2755281 RepID=A0AA38MQU7_9CUCU|nr:hypothetical protein Zmor_000081 [Zophobas morio]
MSSAVPAPLPSQPFPLPRKLIHSSVLRLLSLIPSSTNAQDRLPGSQLSGGKKRILTPNPARPPSTGCCIRAINSLQLYKNESIQNAFLESPVPKK